MILYSQYFFFYIQFHYFNLDEDLSSGSSSDSDNDSDEYPTTSIDSYTCFNNLFTYQLTQPLGNWEKHTRVKYRTVLKIYIFIKLSHRGLVPN